MWVDGFDAIKLEGGRRVCPQIKAIADGGMLVMGHIGLTPQSINQLGGWKVQGKNEKAIQKLLEDAKELEQVGVFSIVLEGLPPNVTKKVTDQVNIPTIGIGAGINCDGQVLVVNDMLGLTDFQAKFGDFLASYYMAKDADLFFKNGGRTYDDGGDSQQAKAMFDLLTEKYPDSPYKVTANQIADDKNL